MQYIFAVHFGTLSKELVHVLNISGLRIRLHTSGCGSEPWVNPGPQTDLKIKIVYGSHKLTFIYLSVAFTDQFVFITLVRTREKPLRFLIEVFASHIYKQFVTAQSILFLGRVLSHISLFRFSFKMNWISFASVKTNVTTKYFLT